MKINFGDGFGKAFRFAFSFKRWFPFFIVNTVFFLIFLGLTIPNLEISLGWVYYFFHSPFIERGNRSCVQLFLST